MEGMYIVLGGVGIVACCLYLWSAFTKSGKNGLRASRAHIFFALLCPTDCTNYTDCGIVRVGTALAPYLRCR